MTDTPVAGLAPAVAAWVSHAAAADIVAVEAIPGGGTRRTALITVRGPDGPRDLVLQESTDAGPYVTRGVTSLKRQAALFQALATTGAAPIVPRLVAVSEDDRLILTGRLAGRSQFESLPAGPQREALNDAFVDALTRLHAVDAAAVDVPGMPRPHAPRDAARNEVRTWARLFTHVRRPAPLVRFALRWLDEHAPECPERPVVCHGDVGPGNFMFDGQAVTGLVDWELSHLGDFHDDLGRMALRACQLQGMGDLNAMLRRYAAASGRRVDPWRVRYYRAVCLVLGAVTSLVQLDCVPAAGGPRIALPLYLHLVPMLQLWLAEALLDLADLAPEEIDLPAPDPDVEALDVADALKEAGASLASLGRAGGDAGFDDLLLHLQADARYGAAVRGAELDDLERLLGERPADVQRGRAALDMRLQAGRLEDRALLAWSWRSARRQSLLWPAWAPRFQTRLAPVE
ncbi:MAG: phosphotransferase family protein [Gammaproteobacteria bacterium]